MIIEKYTGTGGDVIIPALIDGKRVNRLNYYLFRDCRSITGITIPDGITTIEAGTFYGCSGLTNVLLPDSITIIGDTSFIYCVSLTSIKIPDNVKSIGEGAFFSCGLTNITLPDSLTTIGKQAFYNCDELTNITIPGSVSYIGESAFSSCDNLETINVSADNVSYSSIDGILYSKDLRTLVAYPNNREGVITISDNVTDVAIYAFNTCRKLTGIIIPDSVTAIGNYAFEGCTNLEAINVNAGNTKYSSRDGILYSKDYSTLIKCPMNKAGIITIPDGVLTIGNRAFLGCVGIISTIPDSVTSIENYAFTSCAGLINITIPNGVTSIEDSVFWRCYNLISVTIPESVTSIASGAFYACMSLVSVTFAGDNISFSSFSSGAFNGDIREKYLTEGKGTYVRVEPGPYWTKLD